jgi:hypothetical protein
MFSATGGQIANILDRLAQTTAPTAPPPDPPTLEFAAAQAVAVLKQLSPRSAEHCSAADLTAQLQNLSPPSAGAELEAAVTRALTCHVREQRESAALRSTKSLAVRKNSNGDQRTPTTPEVMGDYLDQVSKPALSPGGAAKLQEFVRETRRAAVDGARAQQARHAGRPFGNITNDEEWGEPGSVGQLHAVLTKHQAKKKEKGPGDGEARCANHTWLPIEERIAAAALQVWAAEGGDVKALVAARHRVATRLALTYDIVKPHMPSPRAA